jgi:serine/threonine-protein kinase
VFAPGSHIGKYVLRRKLGQGGFGSVFAAYDESLDREVALKILNAEHKTSEDVMRRFLQEARLAARIGHPGIVTVFECAMVGGTGTPADGVAYIAMELLDGESLAHRLHRSGRMNAATAMELTRQIAAALHVAHKNGIVHRDLKPDNIFLVRDPAVMGGERVKVLDFGIAKLHTIGSSVHTQTSEVFGTPRYMSPEQCRSSTQIDARSDIYTLGCIFFELVTGRPPFVGQTGELFAQHLMVEAPSVMSFVRDTPYHVADLIRRMLAKDVGARPATMADVQRELEAGGAIHSGVPATLPPGISGSMPHAPPIAEADSTLKAAAGVSMLTAAPKPPKAAVYAVAAGLAIVIALALVFWLRGSSDDTKVAANAPAAETPKPKVTATAIEEEAPKHVEAKKAPIVPENVAAARPVEEAKPAKKSSSSRKKDEPKVAKVEPKVEAPKVEPSPNKNATVNPFPEKPTTGTLLLRSSPPCEILVDGKAIAASTPYELKLSVGKHRITLVQDEFDIKDSFSVEIKPGATEKVHRDLQEKIKAKKRNATIDPFGGG